MVFRTFRRQQLARFLPGLKKLGLDQLPHAVACAQYHYLSNQVGGVKVEYVYESDTKAWVRYPPPRWIWSGTAICGIPSEVSRAMLRGWHANNGVVLGNPRLGFVCTGQTVDGQPGLEGYYKEWDHDLAPEERLQFSPGERCPPFQADLAPRLPENTWPEERLQKVLRNYAMEYVTSIVPETIAVLGPEEGGHLAGAAARLVGMHTFDEVAALLGGVEAGAAGFAKAFARLARGQDDDAELQVEGSAATVRQTSWRLMAEREALSPAVFDAWNELWVGAALAHDRFMRVEVTQRRDRGDPAGAGNSADQNEKAAPGRCHSHVLRSGRDQVFVIVILTPRISPLESICTICLLPLVFKFRLAANPEASTNTSIWPPPAVPCRLPKIFRLFSLQLPEMRSPWLVTSLERSNL